MKRVLFLFSQLTDHDVEWLIKAGTKQKVSAGEKLIQEGEPIRTVYIVLDGMLRVTQQGQGGRHELARLGAGEVAGEMSFIDGRPPSATVEVLEDGVLFSISRSTLESKLSEDTQFAAHFYRAIAMFLSQRLRSMSAQLAGDRDPNGIDSEEAEEDELDPNILDTVHLAGTRFSKLVQTVMGS